MSFIEYRTSANSEPYAPLVIEDNSTCAPWIIEQHRRKVRAQVHPLGCHLFDDLVVTGRGHLWQGKQHVDSRDVLPKYWKDIIDRKLVNLQVEFSLPERTLVEPCIVFMGHGSSIYGHVLLEMVLRLQLAFTLGFDKPKLLFNAEAANWVVPLLLTCFPIEEDQLVYYNPSKEKIRLLNAIVPTMLHAEDHFHPAANEVIDQIMVRLGVLNDGPMRRFAICRRKFRNEKSVQRTLLNEDVLWDYLVEQHNFQFIYPEELSWIEQVALFNRAELVVGAYGSALHNAIFSPSSVTIGSIGFLNFMQSAIGALRKHRQAFIATSEIMSRQEVSIEQRMFCDWADRLVSSIGCSSES